MTVDFLLAHGRRVDLDGLTGVYFLLKRGRVMYVGQGANIYARIALHLQSYSFDGAFWIPVEHEELDAAEGAFTRYFNPLWVHHTPADESRDAEILSRYGLEPNASNRDAFVERRRRRLMRAFNTPRALERRREHVAFNRMLRERRKAT